MLALHEDMMLYHGSYTAVPEIDLNCCAVGRDFGRGFYLTSDYEQAKSFVRLSVKKREAETGASASRGCVSRYRVVNPAQLLVHVFESADEKWLHFVSANRRKELFPSLVDEYRRFDVIVGKIANDQTARTLQLYVTEGFGIPGTPAADQLAISALLPNRLSNQFCFRSEGALAHLVFEGSDCYAC